MLQHIRTHKLQYMTGLGVVSGFGSILSAVALFAVPPILLHLAVVGILALAMLSIVLFSVRMLVDRERANKMRELETQRADAAETRERELQSRIADDCRKWSAERDAANAAHTDQCAGLLRVIASMRALGQESSQVLHIVRRATTADDLQQAERCVDQYFQNVVDRGKEMFETLWPRTQRCRICIKYVVEGDRVQVVFRDAITGRVEKGKQPKYRIDDYTSLSEVFSGRRPYFFATDLAALAKAGNYANPEKDWQLKYQSNLVNAIAKTDAADGVGRDLSGFLCISTLEPGIMYEQRDAELAQIMATYLYNVLAALDGAKRALQNPPMAQSSPQKVARRRDSRAGDSDHARAS